MDLDAQSALGIGSSCMWTGKDIAKDGGNAFSGHRKILRPSTCQLKRQQMR